MKQWLNNNSVIFYAKIKQFKSRPSNQQKVIIIKCEENGNLCKIIANNVEEAGKLVDITGNHRYNWLHNLFTVAKRQGKNIVHLKNSAIGECFVIKEKHIDYDSSIGNLIKQL